jgi:NTP pyrophosphatase (non-canonical NTP hydrolase)
MDEKVTIAQLKNEIKNFIEEREWKKYHKPKDLAISISIEAAELLENFQWLTNQEIKQKLKDPEKLGKIKSELADVIVYAFSLSNRLSFDVSEIISGKIKENKKKYPVEKIKGKYKKYTEII